MVIMITFLLPLFLSSFFHSSFFLSFSSLIFWMNVNFCASYFCDLVSYFCSLSGQEKRGRDKSFRLNLLQVIFSSLSFVHSLCSLFLSSIHFLTLSRSPFPHSLFSSPFLLTAIFLPSPFSDSLSSLSHFFSPISRSSWPEFSLYLAFEVLSELFSCFCLFEL